MVFDVCASIVHHLCTNHSISVQLAHANTDTNHISSYQNTHCSNISSN